VVEKLILKLPLASLLVKVTVLALLDPTATVPKAALAGAAESGFCPVAVRFTSWGVPAALSLMVTSPEMLPAIEGVAVTLMVHSFPGCTAPLVQLSVSAKSPLAATADTLSAPVPVLVTAMALDELVVPTICGVKVKLVGDKLTEGSVTDKVKLKTVPNSLAPPFSVVPYKFPLVAWISPAKGRLPSVQLVWEQKL
jgi:hypothetical protein